MSFRVDAPASTPNFLHDGGQMGSLMRAHDWALTPLGPPESWPAALKTAVRLILNSGHPMYVWWGPDLLCFYNDAYSRTLGPERHPGSLGQPGRDVWAEIWHLIGHQVDFVMEGHGSTWDENRAVPITRFGRLDEIYWTYSYSPIDDETAPNGVGGVLVVCTETTESVLAARRLKSETERQRRLFEQAPGFIAILTGPDHVFEFANESYDRLFNRRDVVGKSAREAFPELGDQAFFELLDGVYATGERFVAKAMPIRLQPTPEAEPTDRFLDFIYEPVRDEGGTVTGIFVEGYDVTERVRAEAQLREGDERYLALFNAIDQGFCTIEVAFDENETPTDYRFLEISPSFERQTGIENGAGRWMREIAPDQDQHWFDTYGGVALTGEPARFESYSTPLDRWFDVYAFRISGPRRVALLFRDITDQKRAEARLRESEARLAFLDRLGAETAPLADADAVLETTTRVLGEHLKLSVCAYADMDEDEDGFTIRGDWAAPGATSIVGHYSLADFGKLAVKNLSAGQPLVINDNLSELPPEEAATFQHIGIAATICMPLVKEGRLTALMAIHDRVPRVWTEAELGLLREVTARSWAHVERVGATAELRESESRFRLMADAVPQIVWITDRHGRMEFLNRQFVDYTGAGGDAWAPSEMAANFIHPNDGANVVAAFEAALRTGEPFEIEHRIRSAAGEDRWFLARAEPYCDPGTGEIVRWFGASVDIHDRKVAEERLRELNDNLEQRVAEALAERRVFAQIIESTDAAVLACDLDFGIMAINAATTSQMSRLYGVRPVVGDNLFSVFAAMPEHGAQIEKHWARALAGEEFVVVDEFGDSDRGRLHFEVRFQPLLDRDGRRIGASQTAYDVSARVRAQAELAAAQEALRQSQKMEAMGQLTGGVAHDFNNLLTPIVGSLDLLQRKGIGSEREQRLIAGAMQSADRAKTLVQRLLAFARRQPLQTQAVDVGGLVEGMTDLVASTSGPKIKVQIDAAEELPAAKADANQVEMAILNLAVNARDAMPDGGTLTISAKPVTIGESEHPRLKPGRYVRLTVADTGSGMDQATLKRAVEPFFSTKGIGRGTGLGLSMVHGLASQLCGDLVLTSKPGLGTCVELYLPASDEAVSRPGQVEASDARPTTGTVLLVDDEELVRNSTADMLADLGYAVVEADCAEAALRLVDGGQAVDVLVTDHMMPGLSGIDLVHALRDRRIDVPVLVVSGYADAEGLGPDLPRLVKPFRQADLAAKLRELDGETTG